MASSATPPGPQAYEIRPDAHALTTPDSSSPTAVDYAPDPTASVPHSPEQGRIIEAITSLYSGSASETDMRVYAETAVYDDPLSFCDTRYKIAGQWYGIPKLFSRSRTLATQVVAAEPDRIIFKLRQEYTPRGGQWAGVSKAVNSLVTLSLDEEGKVKYHKDMWNEKDYSHGGLGAVFKKLNGDYLTGVTRPPDTL